MSTTGAVEKPATGPGDNRLNNGIAILMAGIALVGMIMNAADGYAKFKVVEAAVSDIKSNMKDMQGDIKTLLGKVK